MKTFIVFLALILVFVSFLAFTCDMDKYVKLQDHLKVLAEDCACGSSLFTDEGEYAAGRLVINQKDAEEYVAFLIGKAQECMPPLANGRISAKMTIYDDEKGYDGAAAYGFSPGRPGAVVTLTYTGPDMFRLPFFSVSTATRTAVYRWEE